MMRVGILILVSLLCMILLPNCNPRETTVDLAQSTAGLFELNTRVNQYLTMPDSDQVEGEFGGYEFKLIMQAVKPGDLNGIDSFRITIDTRYSEKIGSQKKALAVPALKIDSLTIKTMLNDSVFQPPVFADNYVESKDNPQIRNKRLPGPTYRYELTRIPSVYTRIVLSFGAKLVDRKTNSVVDQGRLEWTLGAVSQLKYYQLY